MVNPLIIAAATTAGIGAAVAFELAVFRPWREENWPHGLRESLRTELEKLRRELEEGVDEIRNDIRNGLRGGERGRARRTRRDRLTDEELDEFRRSQIRPEQASHDGVERFNSGGDGLVGSRRRSASSENLMRGEFEMHEKESNAYRDHLAASMGLGRPSGLDPRDQSSLRHRKASGSSHAQTSEVHRRDAYGLQSTPGPADDPFASPEVPHHALGEASPSMTDKASLVEEVFSDDAAPPSASEDKPLSLAPSASFAPALEPGSRSDRSMDHTESLYDPAVFSWHAAFGRSSDPDNSTGTVHAPALLGSESGFYDTWKDVARSSAGEDHESFRSPSPALSHSLVDLDEAMKAEGSSTSAFSVRTGPDDERHAEVNSAPTDAQTPFRPLESQSFSLYEDVRPDRGSASPSLTATSGTASERATSDLLGDDETWLPLEASSPRLTRQRALAESDEESWAELDRSEDSG